MTAPPKTTIVIRHPAQSAARAFGSLRVRPKLVLLHNLFFIVLALAVYLSVIPVFSRQILNASQREVQMMKQIFAADLPFIQDGLNSYDYRVGPAEALGLSAEGHAYLERHPTGIWQQEGEADILFRTGSKTGEYRRVGLSPEFYAQTLREARVGLFLVLGTIYLLSILVLEFMIMPQYVYKPLRLMLNADEATLRNDREHEMIDENNILDDEIGQIMKSRNQTVGQLRQQEESLASALQKLEEQDRLVSLGILSTSVAHELNTPLAVLQGSIEKMLETTSGEVALERLRRMLRVTQRLRKISESLIDFARVRKQEMERVPLFPLIDESWSLVAIDEKAAEVVFSNRVNAVDSVVGNPDRLIQVFVNLLRNAVLAVPAGGAVCVESKRLQRNGQSWISCSVQDNGPGIPADVLSNLFEAFVSTRLDARGTGLGLTVAEGIITQHGGTIAAFNRPEGGALLEVVLPSAA